MEVAIIILFFVCLILIVAYGFKRVDCRDLERKLDTEKLISKSLRDSIEQNERDVYAELSEKDCRIKFLSERCVRYEKENKYLKGLLSEKGETDCIIHNGTVYDVVKTVVTDNRRGGFDELEVYATKNYSKTKTYGEDQNGVQPRENCVREPLL